MMSAVTAEARDNWPEWRRVPPTHYEFPDKAGKPQTLDGWRIARESTEADKPRWTEIEVFMTVTGKYVIHTLGRSVIYHRHDSECNTGKTQLGQDMDADMVPCYRCRPSASYTDEEYDEVPFDVEVDIPTIIPGLSAKGVITALHWRGNDKEPGGSLSYLAGRLLWKLGEADPAIRAELSKPVDLN
jgi:hypothetical protein